ncbi:unnamed protein product [Prunus armeniaca]
MSSPLSFSQATSPPLSVTHHRRRSQSLSPPRRLVSLLIIVSASLSPPLQMEPSHSNIPNTSNPQTQTETPETQPPTQTQHPTHKGIIVGDRRKTRKLKNDGNQ